MSSPTPPFVTCTSSPSTNPTLAPPPKHLQTSAPCQQPSAIALAQPIAFLQGYWTSLRNGAPESAHGPRGAFSTQTPERACGNGSQAASPWLCWAPSNDFPPTRRVTEPLLRPTRRPPALWTALHSHKPAPSLTAPPPMFTRRRQPHWPSGCALTAPGISLLRALCAFCSLVWGALLLQMPTKHPPHCLQIYRNVPHLRQPLPDHALSIRPSPIPYMPILALVFLL